MDRASKLASLRKAWLLSEQREGTPEELALSGAVAEHETRCGDAWPGEHNWGGLQMAKLDAAEQTTLQVNGIVPKAPYTDAGATMLAAARSLLQRPGGALHADSSPTRGWYFVWFHAFANDDEGAAFFVPRLLGYARVREALATGDPAKLAEAMYRARYFEGFHKPDPFHEEAFAGEWPRKGWLRKGPLTRGETANVLDYAAALAKLVPLWKEAMKIAVVTGTSNPSELPNSSNHPEKPDGWKSDIRPGEGVRERVARIAREHAPLTVAKQRVELGTFLSAGLEKDPLLLARTPTSCGTFARAVLLHAGCEDPLLKRPYEIATAIGRLCQLAGVWTHMRAWRPCRVSDGWQPQRGDIFRLNTPGTNDDHVGVIVDVLGRWEFATAEGGQAPTGCDVGAFVRKFIVRGDQVFCGTRPLAGWIDCTAVGLPESPTIKPPVVEVEKPVAVREEPATSPKAGGLATGGAVVVVAASSQWLPWWAVAALVVAVVGALVAAALRRV